MQQICEKASEKVDVIKQGDMMAQLECSRIITFQL